MKQHIPIITLLFLFLVIPLTVKAQEVVFKEDFSGNLSQWQPLRDDGRYWSIKDGELEATIPLSSTISELIPIEEAWKHSDSYVIDMDYTAIQGADKNIAFGVVDKNNWYEIHFTPSASQLVKVKNNNVIWQKSISYILPTGVKNHLSVIFIKGTVHILVNGLEIMQAVDPTFESSQGKIAVKATTGSIFPTKIRIDNVLVRAIQDEPDEENTFLDLALLKQDDTRWAQEEYDTATQWAGALEAGTTIKEWGCNLLSQLMILQYHNITKLADGTELTPTSLNDWLLNNNGFYGNPPSGNINRKAISKLTAEVSAVHNTPTLEFTYIDKNMIPTAIAEIEKGNPVILELEGHFVVAYGFNKDKTDLLIRDPAYSHTTLSEHTLALKSVRLFTPSFTDLSYISVTSSNNSAIDIQYSAGTVMPVKYKEVTRLVSTNQQTVLSPATYVTELAKPDSGKYTILIENKSEYPQSVSLLTYDKYGSSQQFDIQVNKGKKKVTIAYDKEGKSVIHQEDSHQYSFTDLRKSINALATSNQIKQLYFKRALIQLIKPAEKYSAAHQRKLLIVVKAIIAHAPKSVITKPAQTLLLEQVGLLMAQLS